MLSATRSDLTEQQSRIFLPRYPWPVIDKRGSLIWFYLHFYFRNHFIAFLAVTPKSFNF